MLDVTLDVDVGEEVAFALSVHNAGDDAVTLSFSDSQRVDFVVRDDGELWRFSEGRMFAQMLDTETVEPDGTVTYRGAWPDPEPGTYEVTGEVTCTDRELSATATFTVPA